jgi:hypothetical protein
MIEGRLDDSPIANSPSSKGLGFSLRALSLLLIASFLASCASQVGTEQAATTTTTQTSPQQYPDVVSVDVDVESDGTYRFEVTISSPYDSPERYADAWRILAPDGTQLAIRELLHDHATEQPFTRSLSGVELPEGIETVTVEGRDLEYGWGGATVDVDVSEISP